MGATDRLTEIQARVEATTEGPWRAKHERGESGDWSAAYIVHDYTVRPGKVWPDQVLGYFDLDDGDAEFIAAARQDVPALVAALRVVLTEVEAMRRAAAVVPDKAQADALRAASNLIRNAIEGALLP